MFELPTMDGRIEIKAVATKTKTPAVDFHGLWLFKISAAFDRGLNWQINLFGHLKIGVHMHFYHWTEGSVRNKT